MMTGLAVRSLLLLSSACYLACASVLLAGHEGRNMKPNTKAHVNGLGIVGGQRAQLKDAPYYAFLQNKVNIYDIAAGAVIVHERYVLTTGYVVRYYIDVSQYSVVCGCDDLFGPKIVIDIEEPFVNPNISFTGRPASRVVGYDISVIKLKEKIDFDLHKNVKPIKMADSSLVLKPGDQLKVMGFGQTDEALLPRYMQSVNVPYYDFKKCADLFKKDGLILTKTVICAGGEKGKAPCMYDFGQPLVHNNDTLVGFSSILVMPCGINYPDIYTDIASVRPYIDGIIKSEL